MSYLTENAKTFLHAIALKDVLDVVTATATVSLTAKSGRIQAIDPGGASRNVDVPGIAEGLLDSDGHWFIVHNTGSLGEVLTIRDPAASTISTVPAGGAALVVGTTGETWVQGALGSSGNAAEVTITDAAANFTGTSVEAALAELATPPTLTAALENTNVIDVTFQAPQAAITQWIAEIYSAAMVEETAANFALAETGLGAEVSTTAQARLLFTTDANGAATLSVTDVMGASGATVYLRCHPAAPSAGIPGSTPAIIALTFD